MSMASLPSFAGIGTSTPRRYIEAGPSTWTIASAPTVTELTSEGETEIIERCMAEAEASRLKRCRESEREDEGKSDGLIDVGESAKSASIEIRAQPKAQGQEGSFLVLYGCSFDNSIISDRVLDE